MRNLMKYILENKLLVFKIVDYVKFITIDLL